MTIVIQLPAVWSTPTTSQVELSLRRTELPICCSITSSTLYKSPQDFMLAMDTYYVESFNNSMNMFQDKRISFGDLQYSVRSQLAVCHWNEMWTGNLPRFGTHERTLELHAVLKAKRCTQNALINIGQKYGIPTWTICISKCSVNKCSDIALDILLIRCNENYSIH